jgi:hypothetical protein
MISMLVYILCWLDSKQACPWLPPSTPPAAHLQISHDLKAVTNQYGLTDVGELEQNLVLGEKTSKEMLEYLRGGGCGTWLLGRSQLANSLLLSLNVHFLFSM